MSKLQKTSKGSAAEKWRQNVQNQVNLVRNGRWEHYVSLQKHENNIETRNSNQSIQNVRNQNYQQNHQTYENNSQPQPNRSHQEHGSNSTDNILNNKILKRFETNKTMNIKRPKTSYTAKYEKHGRDPS